MSSYHLGKLARPLASVACMWRMEPWDEAADWTDIEAERRRSAYVPPLWAVVSSERAISYVEFMKCRGWRQSSYRQSRYTIASKTVNGLGGTVCRARGRVTITGRNSWGSCHLQRRVLGTPCSFLTPGRWARFSYPVLSDYPIGGASR